MLKQQIRPRFAKGKVVTELVAQSLDDNECIGKQVQFLLLGETKPTKGILKEIVPIEAILGEKYGQRKREQGIEFGYAVEYKDKTGTHVTGATYIYEV